MAELTPIEAAAVAKAKAWRSAGYTSELWSANELATIELGFACGWLQGRDDALEEAAKVVEDEDVVQYTGYEGGDNGRKTLGNAARAIRALRSTP